jgi:hypothetical protein
MASHLATGLEGQPLVDLAWEPASGVSLATSSVHRLLVKHAMRLLPVNQETSAPTGRALCTVRAHATSDRPS